MAYFLPSYFQKRLLRYALTRLDLIETDALNLEDLDISLGQRSVVELKNVGIKVEKLIEKLRLPSTLVLKHALIRQLRITVPADLHVSGIIVEVDGVDIHVEVQEQSEDTHAPTGGASGAPHARTPTVVDAAKDDRELGHVIPTSQDLAKSFLETEPRRERAELEAAIQSQSYMSDSTASLEETGLGLPGGFSLPGFVANFFSGVADRLAVKIRNVEVAAGLQLSADGSPAETVKVMFRLAGIRLEGLTTASSAAGQQATQQRRIELNGFEVLLLSEAQAFTQHSTTSSPRLTRSRSKAASARDSEELSQFESPGETFAQPQRQRSNGTESVPSGFHLDARLDESPPSTQPDMNSSQSHPLLEDSQLFESYRRPHPQADYSVNSSSESIDNRQHAERLVATGDAEVMSRSMYSTGSSQQGDLAESRMFTHEEAESMYLSAVSDNVGMPGGWHLDDRIVREEPEQSRAASPARAQTPDYTQSRRTKPPANSISTPQRLDASSRESSNLGMSFAASFPDLVAKRLVDIDRLIVSMPSTLTEKEGDRDGDDSTVDPLAYGTDHRRNVSSRERRPQAASQLVSPSDDISASLLGRSVHSRVGSRDFTVSPDYEYNIELGQVSCYVDMSICRILVKTASAVKRMFPVGSPDTGHGTKSEQSFAAQAKLGGFVLNICQSVPEAGVGPIAAETDLRDSYSQACLLQLSLFKLQHEVARQAGELRQKLTIEKIEVGQASEKFLYFTDTMNIRDSLATSVMIRPNDLVVTNVNDRFDVQLKPVHIVTDLLRVDDVLSRGGGLDSLLDLGNSVVSAGTVRDPPNQPVQSPVRQRVVRFDGPPSQPRVDSEGAPGPKIDVRISGATLELIGSETSLQLRTSAIKMVSRQNVFRTQIDHATLLGPLVHGSRSSADINVKISNVALLYMNTPEEEDLDRLLSLLTPSSNKYDEEDDIMVDTLIRQRRKGGVMRLSTADVQISVRGIGWHKHVSRIGDELAKLSAVSKYLPEDDRPGVLLFGLINKVGIKVDLGRPFGMLHIHANLLEGAQVSVPSLVAAQVSGLSVRRGEDDVLLREVIPNTQDSVLMGPPMLMCRFIADEMEPTVRIKCSNTQFEYKVATVIALNELLQTLPKNPSQKETTTSPHSSELSSTPSDSSDLARKIRFSVSIRNSALGLNPDQSTAKGVFLLSDASVSFASKQEISKLQLDFRKASILIINDVAKIGHEAGNADHKLYFEENDQVQDLIGAGFVPVGSISNASAIVEISKDKVSDNALVDVEFRNNLFLLETCADSTQTLIQILSGLSPPSAPSPVAKYRTEVVPIQDMLASFTGNAYVSEPGPELGLQASQAMTARTETDVGDSDEDDDDEEDEEDYDDDLDADETADEMEDSYMESELSNSTMPGSVHIAPVSVTAEDPGPADSVMMHSMLDFRTDHFVQKSSVGGTAHRWNSARDTYESGSEMGSTQSPLKVRVRDVHIIWNLFDGYDWQTTRDTISQAVQDIETKAASRQSRKDSRRSPGIEDDESVIGDFLFNSIYIGIPASKDFKDLTTAINHDIGDLASETGSYATGTTVTAIPSNRAGVPKSRPKKLRLNRSRQHKMTFELKGVSADILVFPPGSGEVESSVDVRVNVLEIFDHVPTSTWKKFATYMHEAGEKEVNTSMVHLELLNVKPVAELAASEIVLKLTVLPLRLHVDQDALDFMTRFFEFKDESATATSSNSQPPFIQRVEVNPIRLRLDFKPKRVDYAGLRSGRTTEFMNFFVLDRSDMVLRRVILYGVSGLDRVGIMLNNIWSPDVKRNQLPGVLAGLAPIRPFVDVTSGVRDLIAVPIREYKKDGRIVRSIQKGALAFAKTTTTELVNLGAKLAIGTQTVLQNAEDMLLAREREEDEEIKEQISLYADQPIGIVQGLRGAYASLERDLLLAKDAIVAVPGEIMASGSAKGAAAAVLKQSPTIILRPAIGASKAVGQTLLGAGNTLDRGNLRRIEQKYKRH